MIDQHSHKVALDIRARYEQRTKKSQAHDARAKKSLPGGDTRTATYFFPYPTYLEKGHGCYVYDVDGNEYIDLLSNYTSLIHGHAHPAIVKAIKDQAEKGTILSSPGEIQYLLSEEICERIKAMDSVRFCNSGTEASLFAIRAARAFTLKDKVIKIDGGFHGTHDLAEVNIFHDLTSEGPPQPKRSPGVPASVLQDVLVAPFNDLSVMEDLLKAEADKVAAIIVEPIIGAGGMIPAQEGYLSGLRELADHFKVLLILDEVISFRAGIGGFQEVAGVVPDLTVLGKIIGGGLPVGAFGGKSNIMHQFEPSRDNHLWHSGTFNGANIVMAAGLASMRALDQSEIERINRLGEHLKKSFNEIFRDLGIRGQMTGYGSLNHVQWTDGIIRNARENVRAVAAAGELPALFHLELMNRGIYTSKRGFFTISTPMTDREVDKSIEAFRDTLDLLRPYISEKTPQLMAE